MSKIQVVEKYLVRFIINASFNSLYSYIKESSKVVTFAFADMNMLSYIILDEEFRKTLQSYDFIIPDGISTATWLKIKLKTLHVRRLTGPDFFSYFLKNDKEFSHIFIGSSYETLHRLVKKAIFENPNLKILGIYSPPFEENFSNKTNKRMLTFIEEKQPDILWISFGCPKQEQWIYENYSELAKNVKKAIIPVGAAFNFYAGTVKRAPYWMRRMGLESLYRFLYQPKKVFYRWRKGIWALIYDSIHRGDLQ